MSTRIYNAYRYDGTLTTLMPWLFNFRKRHTRHVLKKLTSIFKPEAEFMEIAALIREITKSGLNNDLNLTASVQVYVHKDNIYVQFFGVDKPQLKNLNHRFKDFHYQNSSDGPDDIPEKEWEVRGKIWDEISSHGATFAENGLTFELVPNHFEYEVARHVCKVPR